MTVSLFSGLFADYLSVATVTKDRERLVTELMQKGYSDSALRIELRKRETGSFSGFHRILFGFIIYATFICATSMLVKSDFKSGRLRLGTPRIPEYEFAARMGWSSAKLKEEQQFIANAIEYFGDYRTAGEHYLEQARHYYKHDEDSLFADAIMKAWLLNRTDFNCFWLGGKFLYDHDYLVDALRLLSIANKTNPYNCELTSDLAKTCTRCAHSSHFSEEQRTLYAYQAEVYFWTANENCPRNDYIYCNWAEAFYWDGEYEKAAETLRRISRRNGKIDSTVLNLINREYPVFQEENKKNG